MEVAKSFQGSDTAVMAITHSRSNNVIGFFWNDYEIVPKWIIRSAAETYVEDMNILHKMAMEMSVKEDERGLLEVKFGLLDRKLFLADTGKGYSLVFLDNGKHAILKEIYVDLSNPAESSCICLCERVGGERFTHTITLNLSFMESFM